MTRFGVNGQVAVPAGGQVKVPTPRVDQSCSVVPPLSGSGFAHAVGLAVGDHDVGVVQQPVEQADGGGVLGQEPAPWSKGQWLAMPRARRS